MQHLDQVYEVSSIGSDGRVYFKGSRTGGAWPDQLTLLCRKADETEQALNFKRKAANRAALRARTDSWTLAKRSQLQRFEVNARLAAQTAS